MPTQKIQAISVVLAALVAIGVPAIPNTSPRDTRIQSSPLTEALSLEAMYSHPFLKSTSVKKMRKENIQILRGIRSTNPITYRGIVWTLIDSFSFHFLNLFQSENLFSAGYMKLIFGLNEKSMARRLSQARENIESILGSEKEIRLATLNHWNSSLHGQKYIPLILRVIFTDREAAVRAHAISVMIELVRALDPIDRKGFAEVLVIKLESRAPYEPHGWIRNSISSAIADLQTMISTPQIRTSMKASAAA